MKKIKEVNIYFLIIMLLQLFLPVYILFRALNINDVRLMLSINHMIIFIVPAIIYLLITKQSPKKVLRLNKIHIKDVLIVICLAFVCQPIMTFFSLISQFFFENEIGNFVGQIVSTPYWILLLLIAVLPAITEEITIRGIVLSGYNNKNIYVACIASGLLFGIMHLDPQQFLYATALGFILALVVRITDSIFASVIMHFIINGTSITVQKVVSFLPTTIDSELSLKAISLGEKLVLAFQYGCVAILFSYLAYLLIKKLKKNNIKRGIIDKESFYGLENKESVFNVYFIFIIGIYLLVMIRQVVLT